MADARFPVSYGLVNHRGLLLTVASPLVLYMGLSHVQASHAVLAVRPIIALPVVALGIARLGQELRRLHEPMFFLLRSFGMPNVDPGSRASYSCSRRGPWHGLCAPVQSHGRPLPFCRLAW